MHANIYLNCFNCWCKQSYSRNKLWFTTNVKYSFGNTAIIIRRVLVKYFIVIEESANEIKHNFDKWIDQIWTRIIKYIIVFVLCQLAAFKISLPSTKRIHHLYIKHKYFYYYRHKKKKKKRNSNHKSMTEWLNTKHTQR